MKAFLQRFGSLVAGVLQGFDRLVFKGRLAQLYFPDGMHKFFALNGIRREDFKMSVAGVTKKIMEASLITQAKELGRFCYLSSTNIDKEETARTIAAKHRVKEGLVCVLQCVEPCWTFNLSTGPWPVPVIRGERGRCSQLYHYYIHPKFGWMYVRLQTWFPFEIQVGLNGREWLARQMDQENLRYRRSDNKFLRANWQRAQQLFDEQLQTDWVTELDKLQQQVHPLHPGHLGRMPVKYNWTVFQSEWATDVAFRSQEELRTWFDRWLRQAFLTFDSTDVLAFFGRTLLSPRRHTRVKTTVFNYFEGKRIRHWVDHNSLKAYTHANVLRPETTINNADEIRILRPPADDPEGKPGWQRLRRTVADFAERAKFSQEVNERYLEALAATAETRTVKELAEPLTRRVPEPGGKPGKKPRQLRALNPLAAEDAALLTAISEPKWMVNGLRNRDLVAVLYPTETQDSQERRRRSARVTRLLRLLRAHGLLEKMPQSHRYEIKSEARMRIQALLACRNANPDTLITNAA
jgi:hypothetical protein